MFSFKLAQESQRDLIHHWLSQEYIKKWLHGKGLKNTLEGLENFFQGKPTDFLHWIAYDGETPFAYLLTSDIEKGKSISLDLFICEFPYIGKGYAVPMIHQFLKSQFPNITEVLIDPEAANTRAVHVYKKAGFKIVGTFIAKWHPELHYKMRLDMKDLISPT